MKVVFVCGGNTCRSPLAAAIAEHLLCPSLQTESAGIAPHGDSATSDAVAVAKDLFGIDLSYHRPKGVAPDSLDTSDCVVALDSYVANHLREQYGVASNRLVEWEVSDPYLLGREAYERCAREIEAAVRGLAEPLDKLKPPSGQGKSASLEAQPPSLHVLIENLRQDLARWKNEVSQGRVRGTTLHGIAKKAVDTFEVILRATVDVYRGSGTEDDKTGANQPSGKPFARRTLGELLQFLKENNQRLTAEARRTPAGDALFRNRTVVGPVSGLLDLISRTRNDLHHRQQDFAPDTRTLYANTTDLLERLSRALADSLFVYTAARAPDFPSKPLPLDR
jgi:protein-tyrosine-phosphatase